MEKTLLLFAAISGNPEFGDTNFSGVIPNSPDVSLTFSAIDSDPVPEVATVRTMGMPEVPSVVFSGYPQYQYYGFPVQAMQTYYPVQRNSIRYRGGFTSVQMGNPFPFGEGVDCFGGT